MTDRTLCRPELILFGILWKNLGISLMNRATQPAGREIWEKSSAKRGERLAASSAIDKLVRESIRDSLDSVLIRSVYAGIYVYIYPSIYMYIRFRFPARGGPRCPRPASSSANILADPSIPDAKQRCRAMETALSGARNCDVTSLSLSVSIFLVLCIRRRLRPVDALFFSHFTFREISDRPSRRRGLNVDGTLRRYVSRYGVIIPACRMNKSRRLLWTIATQANRLNVSSSALEL